MLPIRKLSLLIKRYSFFIGCKIFPPYIYGICSHPETEFNFNVHLHSPRQMSHTHTFSSFLRFRSKPFSFPFTGKKQRIIYFLLIHLGNVIIEMSLLGFLLWETVRNNKLLGSHKFAYKQHLLLFTYRVYFWEFGDNLQWLRNKIALSNGFYSVTEYDMEWRITLEDPIQSKSKKYWIFQEHEPKLFISLPRMIDAWTFVWLKVTRTYSLYVFLFHQMVQFYIYIVQCNKVEVDSLTNKIDWYCRLYKCFYLTSSYILNTIKFTQPTRLPCHVFCLFIFPCHTFL